MNSKITTISCEWRTCILKLLINNIIATVKQWVVNWTIGVNMPSKPIDEMALRAVDQQPLTAEGLGVLLNVPTPDALKIVNDLIQRGFLKTLTSMRSAVVMPVQNRGSASKDDPLTLTFRGYIELHPIIRKLT